MQITFQFFQYDSIAHVPKQKYGLLSPTFFLLLTKLISLRSHFPGRSDHLALPPITTLGSNNTQQGFPKLLTARSAPPRRLQAQPSLPTARCSPPHHVCSGTAVLLTVPVLPSALLPVFWLLATSLSPVTWGYFYIPARSPSRIAILQHLSLHPSQDFATE